MKTKQIESQYCPTCGHDEGKIRSFEVPEVVAIDEALASKIVTDITAKLPEFKLDNEAIADAVGKRLTEALDRREPKEEGHASLTPALLETFENCPECKIEWERVKADLTKGYIPETKLAEYVPKAEVEEKYQPKGTHTHITPETPPDCPECKAAWEKLKGKVEASKEPPLEEKTVIGTTREWRYGFLVKK